MDSGPPSSSSSATALPPATPPMPPDAQDEAQSLPNGGRGEVEKKDALAAVALDGIPARMGDGVMGEYVDEGDVDGAAPGVVPNENESERTWCEVELDDGWPAPNEEIGRAHV